MAYIDLLRDIALADEIVAEVRGTKPKDESTAKLVIGVGSIIQASILINDVKIHKVLDYLVLDNPNKSKVQR